MTITDSELDRLEAIANAATSGPWAVFNDDRDWVVRSTERAEKHAQTIIVEGYTVKGHEDELKDLRLIAASRSAVPALIAEVRALRALLREALMFVDDATLGHYGQDAEDVANRIRAALDAALEGDHGG